MPVSEIAILSAIVSAFSLFGLTLGITSFYASRGK